RLGDHDVADPVSGHVVRDQGATQRGSRQRRSVQMFEGHTITVTHDWDTRLSGRIRCVDLRPQNPSARGPTSTNILEARILCCALSPVAGIALGTLGA